MPHLQHAAMTLSVPIGSIGPCDVSSTTLDLVIDYRLRRTMIGSATRHARSDCPRVPFGILEDSHPPSRSGTRRLRSVDARGVAPSRLSPQSRYALPDACAYGRTRLASWRGAQAIQRRTG